LSDQKGLSRGTLDVFSACPMVRPMIEVARRNPCQAATSLEPEFFSGHVSRQDKDVVSVRRSFRS
jgi:hypothetical protein